VRLSLSVFGLPLESYAPIATVAEQTGYDAVWLADHMVTTVEYAPVYPYHPSGRPPGFTSATPLADVWATLGHLTSATSRIKLGTGVYILPLRNPFVTARAAATVQILSGGRLLFGIGAGWLREEYEAADQNFDNRGARMDEIAGILRRLWTGEVVAHSGEHYAFPELQITPALQPPPPIIVGGITPPALRRAARLGDGWFGPACPLAESIAAREAIEAERRRVGRDHLPFSYHVRITDPWNAAEWSSFADAGFEDVVVFPGQLVSDGHRDQDAMVEGIVRLAEVVHG
jgi:probable F420-dependent oxidoreductase